MRLNLRRILQKKVVLKTLDNITQCVIYYNYQKQGAVIGAYENNKRPLH